jgi:3-deoxy-7-phosphoheptulonate synthase
MNNTPLSSPQEIRQLFPLSSAGAQFIAFARAQAKQIVLGKDHRKAIIVGPCSIHDRKSALEYAIRFKQLAQKVEKSCLLVMRVYVEKPRTITGWTGWLYDPHLDGSHQIETGLRWTRELFTTLVEMGIPIATEFVDPLTAFYFHDLITWGFIGARTSASQPHRQLASALPMPVGFKNSTDGNLDLAIHGIIAAQAPHRYIQVGQEGRLCSAQSEGNPFSHLVLRGAHDLPNYDDESVQIALEKLKQTRLNSRLMIDCAHGNSQKRHENQREVFKTVLEQIGSGNDKILGMMLESHLESGNQPLSENPAMLEYGVSITDPCIDWEVTEELVYSADESFSSSGSILMRLTHN